MPSPDKRLQAWRPLAINRRVKLVGKFRKGQHATVAQVEPNNITGLAHYVIILDDRSLQADVARHEITGLKRNNRPDYATHCSLITAHSSLNTSPAVHSF